MLAESRLTPTLRRFERKTTETAVHKKVPAETPQNSARLTKNSAPARPSKKPHNSQPAKHLPPHRPTKSHYAPLTQRSEFLHLLPHTLGRPSVVTYGCFFNSIVLSASLVSNCAGFLLLYGLLHIRLRKGLILCVADCKPV